MNKIYKIRTTVDYLAELMQHYPKIKNDSQLAAHVGVTRQAISQYRNGHNMSVWVAVKVARLLHVNPMETISATMCEQCGTPEEKTFWQAEYKAAETPR